MTGPVCATTASAQGLVRRVCCVTVLVSPDGTVGCIDRREGTWSIGDTAFQSVESTLASEGIRLEAMSVMVHPVTRSIEGCHAYLGFIAYADDTAGPVRLRFADRGRLPVLARVRAHSDGFPAGTSWHIIWDGGVLTIG